MKYIINVIYYFHFIRLDDLFTKAARFYMKDTIPVETEIENIFDLFNNVQQFYSEALRNSIIKQNYISRPMYYNYLLIDGEILKSILEKYTTMDLRENVVSTEDHIQFRKGCFYTGKGKSERKFKHLVDVKKSNNSSLKNNGHTSEKSKKIQKIWKRGHGIAVIQLFPEVCEFEALSREFAIIKAIGLENLTNAINGRCYGVMKENWNMNEIINFGNMMVYRILKVVVQDPPNLMYEKDIK